MLLLNCKSGTSARRYKAPAESAVGTSAHEANGAIAQLAEMLSSTDGGVAAGLQHRCVAATAPMASPGLPGCRELLL